MVAQRVNEPKYSLLPDTLRRRKTACSTYPETPPLVLDCKNWTRSHDVKMMNCFSDKPDTRLDPETADAKEAVIQARSSLNAVLTPPLIIDLKGSNDHAP
ncbi:hypothetical protein O3G_MSEX006956 [Manduca sexta]|uniref:Uncharacterized protein n=1 Tax=Manduca sexta TaxID=7130 RepID=A0A921Z4E1_MANSE|nr:hypothetical protein O3G_MSEX006956 [Manduca sexta]